MLYPTIDNLLEKIDSKYSLVVLASKRASELRHGATPAMEEYKSIKNVGKALEEIAAGDLILKKDTTNTKA